MHNGQGEDYWGALLILPNVAASASLGLPNSRSPRRGDWQSALKRDLTKGTQHRSRAGAAVWLAISCYARSLGRYCTASAM